jgi:hypothetical protein
MKSATKLACLWPGLAQLWLWGHWSGLMAACGFALATNVLILMTLIWPEVAPVTVQASGWVVLALWWAISTAVSLRRLPETSAATPADPHKGLLVLAQGEYLKGNWVEAESLLRRLLRKQAEDAEAMLLLATLLRRSGRINDARLQLQNLARLDAARRWELEIRRERQQLHRTTQEQKAEEEVSETTTAAALPAVIEEHPAVQPCETPSETITKPTAEEKAIRDVVLNPVGENPVEGIPAKENPAEAPQIADTQLVEDVADSPTRRQAA